MVIGENDTVAEFAVIEPGDQIYTIDSNGFVSNTAITVPDDQTQILAIANGFQSVFQDYLRLGLDDPNLEYKGVIERKRNGKGAMLIIQSGPLRHAMAANGFPGGKQSDYVKLFSILQDNIPDDYKDDEDLIPGQPT